MSDEVTISEQKPPAKHPRFLYLGVGGAGGHIGVDVAKLYDDFSSRHKFGGREFVDFAALDTNQSSLIDFKRRMPNGNTLLMGNSTGGIGSGYDTKRALDAFAESKEAIKQLVEPYDAVMPLGSLGKSTGLATIAPISELIRDMGKLTIPGTVLPSFDNGESDVSPERANKTLKDLLEGEFKFIQLLNDAAYVKRSSMPEAYKMLNKPLAQGLVGLISLFTTPSDVDIADMAMQILSGSGRLRIASWELNLGDYSDDKNLKKLQDATTAHCANQMFQFGGKVSATLLLTRGDMDNFVLRAVRKGVRDFLKDHRHSEESPTLKAHYPAPVENFKRAMVTVIFSEYSEKVGTKAITQLRWKYVPDGQLLLPAPTATEHEEHISDIPAVSATPVDADEDSRGWKGSRDDKASNFAHLSALARALKANNPQALHFVATENPDKVRYLTLQEIRESYEHLRDPAVFGQFPESWRKRMLNILHTTTRFDELVIGTGETKFTVNRETPLEELEGIIPQFNGKGYTVDQLQELRDRIAILKIFGTEVLKEFNPVPKEETPGLVGRAIRFGRGARKKSETDAPSIPAAHQ